MPISAPWKNKTNKLEANRVIKPQSYPSTQKMEAVRSSESSVNVYHTGRRQIPENSILFRQPSQNLKCHIQTTSCRVQEYVTNLTPTIPSASSLHIETAWEIERGFIIPEVPCLNPGRCILMSKFWGYFLLSVLKYWRIVASGI